MENKPGRKRNCTFYVAPVLQWIAQKSIHIYKMQFKISDSSALVEEGLLTTFAISQEYGRANRLRYKACKQKEQMIQLPVFETKCRKVYHKEVHLYVFCKYD